MFFKNAEKEKPAAELIIANKELEQLLQLNGDKDLFISILAHDLRSPFNALIVLSQLLKENIHTYNIDEIEDIVNHISESTQNMFTLLEDLLKWARAQSGKIPFEPQKLNFENICQEVIENLKLNANIKNITINHFTPNDVNIFADIDMFKTVIRNLVSNAIKFTNKGGLIEINAKKINQM